MRKSKNKFDNYTYLNVRLVFLLSALVHLVVTAVATLSIDTTVDEDPRIRAYYYTRWKLLTCWFNFCVIVFWSIYFWNIDLLAPPRLWDYLPMWAQHSLHTVSSVVVLLDLLLTPRRRPASLKPRMALLLTFSFLYIWVIYRSYLDGQLVYAVIEGMSLIQFNIMAVLSLGFVFLLFYLQWVATAYGDQNQRQK